MFASSFLDTAIGIIFVFLLLSLIASTINEIILSFFNQRGKTLLEGIETLFNYAKNKEPQAKAKWLVDELYNHGQVFGLFKGDFEPDKTKSNLPSYIPPTNFALAFLGGVLPKAAELLHTKLDAEATTAESAAEKARQALLLKPADANLQADAAQAQKKAAEARAVANTFTPEGFSAVLAKATTPLPPIDDKAALAARAKDVGDAFDSLRTLARFLAADDQYSKVGKPLLALLATAENDINKLRTNLEGWYNSAMDRVSGWYKYNTQWTLFWIGIVLAVVLNANTVAIVKQLSHDPVLRESLVAAAQKQLEKGPPQTSPAPQTKPVGQASDDNQQSASSPKPTDANPQVKTGDTGGAQAPAATTAGSSSGNTTGQTGRETTENPYQKVAIQLNEVEQLGIPIGWSGGLPKDEYWWGILGGWLLTAVAVSLGAPFWFDLLNKFMVVRSTIKPQEKSQEEGSKDKPTMVISALKP